LKNKKQQTEVEIREVQARNKAKLFCHEASEAMEEAAQGGSALSMLGGFHNPTDETLSNLV